MNPKYFLSNLPLKEIVFLSLGYFVMIFLLTLILFAAKKERLKPLPHIISSLIVAFLLLLSSPITSWVGIFLGALIGISHVRFLGRNVVVKK